MRWSLCNMKYLELIQCISKTSDIRENWGNIDSRARHKSIATCSILNSVFNRTGKIQQLPPQSTKSTSAGKKELPRNGERKKKSLEKINYNTCCSVQHLL